MISALLLLAFLFLLFVKYCQMHKKVSRLKKIAWNIPGPKPLPIFGNSLLFGLNSYDSFNKTQQILKQYGPTTAIWLGSSLRVYISDKEDTKAILSSNEHLRKATNLYDFMEPWIGRGLITSDGERWRRNRKILTPTFHFKMLENYISIFNSNYKIMTDLMEAELGNNGFDAANYIGNCVTDNLYESALRVKGNVQMNKNSKFSESQMNVKIGVGERVYKYWLHPKIMFDLSVCGGKFNQGLQYLHSFVNKVIRDKKMILKDRINEDKGDIKEEDNSGKKNLAFIDLMLKIAMDPNTQLTDDDLRFEVNTFVAAGHGTISNALGFLLYELAHHQDIQNKVVQEIEKHFGENNEMPTFQDLQHFPYMDMVIKETLRHYPVPYLGRYLEQDFHLPSGYTVPAGSCIMFDWLQLHKDPSQYSDPDKFNPDHFLPENCAKRHPFAYLPFSAGPRNCIGQKYAMLDIKTALIHVLRRYKLFPSETLPKLKVGYAVILYSITGYNVRIEKRYP